jgi:ribonuclease Z
VKLTLLGTGSPLPSPDRAGPANLVQVGGHNLLFDCGRGVTMRMAAAGVLPGFLSQVLLTHLHSDHVTDLNDLVTTRWAMSPVESPLPVTGPPGTRDLVARTVEMLRDDIGYRLAHHDDLTWEPDVAVTEVLNGLAWQDGDVRVVAAPTDHRPVAPTVGYRVEHHGRSIVLAGDTVPCDGLDRLVAGADVYVQTVIRPDLVAAVPSARLQDICDYHSSCEQAGATAARAGVRTLVLTHQVPPPQPGTDHEWVEQARAGGFDGEIVFGSDLTVVDADT